MVPRKDLLPTDNTWEVEPSATTASVLGGVGGLLGSTVAQATGPSHPAVVTGLITGATVLVGFVALGILD